MIYLHRGRERAACESEARAQALEARGYKRCSVALHRYLWWLSDKAQVDAMEWESIEAQPAVMYTAPLDGRPPAMAIEARGRMGTVVVASLPKQRSGWE